MWEGEKKANIVLATFNLVQLIPQDYNRIIKGIVHLKDFRRLRTSHSDDFMILSWCFFGVWSLSALITWNRTV